MHHGIEILPLELSVGMGSAAHVKEGVLLPFICGCGSHDLLCKNIQRLGRDGQTIENTLTNSLHQRGALNEIITGGGKQSAFR